MNPGDIVVADRVLFVIHLLCQGEYRLRLLLRHDCDVCRHRAIKVNRASRQAIRPSLIKPGLHKSDFHQIIRNFHFVSSMNVRPKRNYGITALQRGLRLLHLFSESPEGLICQASGSFVAAARKLGPPLTGQSGYRGLPEARWRRYAVPRTRMFLDWVGRHGPAGYPALEPAVFARTEPANP